MKYPTISDFFLHEDAVVTTLSEEVEEGIILYMEEYAFSVEKNETEAYSQASQIVLNC